MSKSTKMEDIDTKDSAKKEEKPQQTEEQKNQKKEVDIFQELRNTLLILEKEIGEKDVKAIGTAAKTLGAFRKKLTFEDFKTIFDSFITLSDNEFEWKGNDINVAEKLGFQQDHIDKLKQNTEVQVFFLVLYLMKLLDTKDLDKAQRFADILYDRIKDTNMRTLDHLNAKAYFYIARTYELKGQLSSIRSILYQAHRTACLRFDQISQATLTNLILRSYIEYNLYDQARNFISKSTFPENVSTNQFARYLYYLGRTKAVQLEYSEAQTRLLQAIRKAPEFSAKGFRVQVQKLVVVVELLMGDIPDRTIFSSPDFKKPLRPYFQVVNSVRAGDLATFQQVLTKYAATFQRDKNYSLILRLRHNVIKFGLRKINLAYSRISLQDICNRLNLESVAETEYIVAKTIRDGVIDAIIDHEEQSVKTRPVLDVYTSNIPQTVFHKRIQYCLDLRNEAVRALEFPKKEKKEIGDLQEKADQLNEEDLAGSLDDGDDY